MMKHALAFAALVAAGCIAPDDAIDAEDSELVDPVLAQPRRFFSLVPREGLARREAVADLDGVRMRAADGIEDVDLRVLGTCCADVGDVPGAEPRDEPLQGFAFGEGAAAGVTSSLPMMPALDFPMLRRR